MFFYGIWGSFKVHDTAQPIKEQPLDIFTSVEV